MPPPYGVRLRPAELAADGFYAAAPIVRDAREHGVLVRPLDVNASDWDCTLESASQSAEGYALRLGLRMASGLAAADELRLVRVRRAGNGAPFATPEEVTRRAALRRAALWAARAVKAEPPPLLRLVTGGEPPLIQELEPALLAETEGQSVMQDYTALGLMLGRHPLALLRPQLEALGCQDTRAPAGQPGFPLRGARGREATQRL
ncbi:helix-hairpin-helix domain-containing protein [Teichococcus coralli]|uniref:helix-hairpin-helix domain-containing protein n=1 Tax=Teichococcus coralli TaxID=2545983 RepID=UPI001F3C4B87|nr:hypothetical protein [Pseudoroseomonas coralli]